MRKNNANGNEEMDPSRRQALGILGGSGMALMAFPALASAGGEGGNHAPDAEGDGDAAGGGNAPVSAVVFDAYGTLFNVQAVFSLIETLIPGRGEIITQVWRLKQLEYTWLLSLMDQYEDFFAVTRDSLVYALRSAGVEPSANLVDPLLNAYLSLATYPEAVQALTDLKATGRKVAILSNGSPAMLNSAAQAAGIDVILDKIISVDLVKIYKPSPRVYALAGPQLGVPRREILFVSSNSFDIIGAKNYGLKCAWIRRAIPTPPPIGTTIGPATLFTMLRGRQEEVGLNPDFTVSRLTDVVGLL